MSGDEYCPALPPGLLNKNIETEARIAGPQIPPHLRGNSSHEEESIGPILPPHFRKDTDNVIGPAMPPGFQTNDTDSSEDDSIGPVLPPHLKKSSRKEVNVIGPAMPPGFNSNKTESSNESIGPRIPQNFEVDNTNTNIGPQLPPHITSPPGDDSNDEDDDNIIGPLPSEMLKGDNTHVTTAEIESRAAKMRDRLDGKEEKKEILSRESWMTELPSNKLSQNIGLQARSFRAKAAPDMTDRSSWTDTPADREKKLKEEVGKKRSHADVGQSSRDTQLEKDVKKYNKSNRPESLLEMHQKEIQKKKKKMEDQPKERRPFDREVDLQVNRFDDAQRKAIIKKSQKLDSRFSHGGSHFL